MDLSSSPNFRNAKPCRFSASGYCLSYSSARSARSTARLNSLVDFFVSGGVAASASLALATSSYASWYHCSACWRGVFCSTEDGVVPPVLGGPDGLSSNEASAGIATRDESAISSRVRVRMGSPQGEGAVPDRSGRAVRAKVGGIVPHRAVGCHPSGGGAPPGRGSSEAAGFLTSAPPGAPFADPRSPHPREPARAAGPGRAHERGL